MMAVGSVEYQFPWNARDTFHQIFFTDFGTVTGNYEFSDMRISVGTGLEGRPADVRSHAVRVRPGVSRSSRPRATESQYLQFRRQRELVRLAVRHARICTTGSHDMPTARTLPERVDLA